MAAERLRGLAVAVEPRVVWFLPIADETALGDMQQIFLSGSQRKAVYCGAQPLAALLRAGQSIHVCILLL